MAPTGVLIVHVAGGVFAMVAGFTSFVARKGSRLHRKAGQVFAISMIVMAAGAAILGFTHPEGDVGDAITGLLTIYVVSTGWVTVRRGIGQTGYFEIAACSVAAIGAALILSGTTYQVLDGTAFLGGYPGFILSAVIGLGAALDLRVILGRGLTEKHRLGRHIWRMGLGMFMAAGSFFLGQMDKFPEFLRKLEIVSVPVLLVLGLTVYWLLRVLFTNWFFTSVHPEGVQTKAD